MAPRYARDDDYEDAENQITGNNKWTEMVPKNLRVTLKTMMDNIIMGLEFDPKEAVLHHAEGIDVIPSNKLLSSLAQFSHM